MGDSINTNRMCKTGQENNEKAVHTEHSQTHSIQFISRNCTVYEINFVQTLALYNGSSFLSQSIC